MQEEKIKNFLLEISNKLIWELRKQDVAPNLLQQIEYNTQQIAKLLENKDENK